MLVCTLEFWPHGCDDGKYPVGEVLIRSDGGDHEIGHYTVALRRSAEFAAQQKGPFRSGQVINFPRKLLGPYDLLLRGLIACVGGRSHVAVQRISTDQPIFMPPSSYREITTMPPRAAITEGN